MPPKRGKSAKGKKAKKAPVVEQRDEFDDMDEEQLKREMVTQRAKLAEIRRNRNYYLRERNQFAEFNSIVHQEVTKTRAHIRNIESQMERMQDTHRSDIKIYLQKVIHLEYEHANNVDQVEREAFAAREEDEKDHIGRKNDLKGDKLRLKAELEEAERKYETDIKNLRNSEASQMVKVKQGFEEKFQDMKSKAEQRLEQLKDDMELQRKMEIHEIEERKNRHINDLLANHENAFSLMRQYYNSITRDNLELIRALNEEIELLKAKHEKNNKLSKDISERNKPLAEKLEKTQQEVAKLQHELKNYQKQKASLKHARAGLAVMEEQQKELDANHRALQDSYSKAQRERDDLYRTFEDTVVGVRGRSDARNAVLEKVLDDYKDNFEAKKAHFTAVLRQSNLDPAILHNVTQKLDDVLTSKNEQIKELRYECAKITKAHNDLVRVYEDKLRSFGIPESELDLEPLVELDAHTAGAGSVPAGLIVA